MPVWKMISFQNSASPMMEHLNFLHDHNMMMIIFITFIVSMMMFLALSNEFSNRFFNENQEIEYFWTSIPAFLLMFLAFPSMKILYMTEEYIRPSMTVKITGHQWYWSYEYADFKDMSFDSFMVDSISSRLLQTSNHLILPYKSPIRAIITSDDVIHSWTIPAIGVKVDAIPGRINQLMLCLTRAGIFSGQCSEICGANHSFMPITISSISPSKFINSIEQMNAIIFPEYINLSNLQKIFSPSVNYMSFFNSKNISFYSSDVEIELPKIDESPKLEESDMSREKFNFKDKYYNHFLSMITFSNPWSN